MPPDVRVRCTDGSQGTSPKAPERKLAEYRVPLLPEDGDRIVRVAAAAPVRAQPDLGIVAIPVHARHVLPRPVVAPGDVELVTPGEEARVRLVVDVADVIREHPREDEELVGQRLRATDRRDAVALAVRVEVDDDPLDRRLVRVVADEEAEALHGLLDEGVLAREQVVPTPELLVEDHPDPLDVRLEGLRDALVSLAEADAE